MATSRVFAGCATKTRCADLALYVPRACPINATPAALPMDNSEPPTPAVSVTKSHCPTSIAGCMESTANITGILSIRAESTLMLKPRDTL